MRMMMNRWTALRLLAAGIFARAAAKAAPTLIRPSQLQMPLAVTANQVQIIRPGGGTAWVDIGVGLRVVQLDGRVEIQIDPAFVPAPVTPALKRTPLTLTNGTYAMPGGVVVPPNAHMLICEGIVMSQGDDYVTAGSVITPIHPALKDATTKVSILSL